MSYNNYSDCYLDSMELIRNVESLVLGFLVIGNRVLSISEKHRCQRVCDSIFLLGPWGLSSSYIESIECYYSTTSLRMNKEEGKKLREERKEKRSKNISVRVMKAD